MAVKLTGKEVAQVLREDLVSRVKALEEAGHTPCLAIVRIGENPGDLAYESHALKIAGGLGIRTVSKVFRTDVDPDKFLSEIDTLNKDPEVDGILALRPFPAQISDAEVAARIDLRKDADCMKEENLSGVMLGNKNAVAPCTAESVMTMLDYAKVPLKGAMVTVLGRSNVIGKPVSLMLMGRDATVTICHSKTEDLRAVCLRSDIIVAAMGRAGMIDDSYVPDGAVLIDVGVSLGPDGKYTGDFAPSAYDRAALYTPVPGGVGTVTNYMLMTHVIRSAEKAVFS